MLSCSEEFLLHLSSKQSTTLGFIVTSWRFFGSSISCGHFLPRQCPVPWSTSLWLSLHLPFSGCCLRTPMMLNFLLHLLPCCCLLALWLSPRSHQDSGDQPLLMCCDSAGLWGAGEWGCLH